MPSTSRVSRCGWLIAAVIVLVLTARVNAQGTSGTLPGPINSQRLARYADLLQLSDAQRLAMEAVHDDYRQQFRVLRDGEIAAFLQQQRSVQGGIPKRVVVEELLEQTEMIRVKIALLDDALFDQLPPILSDQQRRWVPRLRMARERQRQEVQLTGVTLGRRIVDLGDVLHELDLAPDDVAAADALIAPYERRMTVIMRKQGKAVGSMTLDVMDQLAERGYVDVTQEELLQDPEMLQAVLGQMQEIYAELRGQITALSEERRELNRRTYRQVAAVISAPAARRFRNAYYRGAYPQLAAVVKQSDDDWMAQALLLDDLTPEQRTALAAASDEHQRRLDQLIKTGIEAIDRFWAGFSPFELNQQAAEQLGTELGEIQAGANAMKTKVETTAANELGEEAVARIREAAATSGPGTDSTRGAATAAPAGDAEEDPAAAYAFNGDRFLPDRISRRDLRRYTKQLQVGDDVSDVLDMLHTDYLERVSQLDVLDELREARDDARADIGDDAARSARDRIARVYALRRRAIEAMAATDAAFFEEVRTILGTEPEALLERVQRIRLRRAYAGNASTRLSLGRHNSSEANVDLVSIVLETQPSADELGRVDVILAAYEDGALPGLRDRLEAQLQMQQMADQWMADIAAARQDSVVAVVELQVRYRDVMREPVERVERTDRAMVELNRRTLEALRSRLPRELADSVHRAYRSTAFPSIYEDPASVDRHLRQAVELDDLSPLQREQLIDLGGSYRTDYETLSGQMIGQLGTSTVSLVGLDPEAFRVWQERQQQMAKIRFDRNELNGRAISRLRAVLTESQIQRLGGLPTPLGEDELYFYR